jgi:hypothetical protein
MQLVINSPGTFITQKDECFRLKQKEKETAAIIPRANGAKCN